MAQLKSGQAERQLTACEDNFMRLLAASLRGGPVKLSGSPTREEWGEILNLSRQQKTVGLIYDAAGKLPAADFPADVRAAFRMEAVSGCILQTERTERFLECLGDMMAAGFHPLVLKGLVCRLLYPKPDLRPSADEDLLVSLEEYQDIVSWLKGKGFSCIGEEPSSEIPQEVGMIRQKDGLYLEIHTLLFSNSSELGTSMNGYFRDIFVRTVSCVSGGVTYETADETLHLLYLYCHYIKHFLGGGVGIRQLCDIMLYAEKNDKKVEWHSLRKWLAELGFDVFCGNLMELCREWFGFSCAGWDREFRDIAVSEDTAPLLSDILGAGIYGTSTLERRHSGVLTTEAVERQDRHAWRRGLWKAIFPSKSYMKKRYLVLAEKPYLLPAAYVRRVLIYLRNRRKNGGEPGGIAVGRERMHLLSEFGLIGKRGSGRGKSVLRNGSRHRPDVRIVGTNAYIDMLLSVIEEGKSVSLVIAGGSMTPFLADGRDRVVIEQPSRTLAVGDIVLFKRESGEYVLHRIRKIKDGKFFVVGDAQTYIEGPIAREQIAALVTAAERKGEVLKKGDLLWDFFERVWIYMVPVRPICIKSYSLYCHIRRKRSK